MHMPTRQMPLSQALLDITQSLPLRRLTRIEFQGKPYFVKMPELRTSLRWRVQKGDPAAAFSREITLLHGFKAKGAPVPDIVAETPDRVILADHGAPMHRMLASGAADGNLMRKTGAALAGLHALGLAHGRPSLRDICWDGTELTFLDLEAGAKLKATPRDQARDLYLLIHSCFTTGGVATLGAAHALDGYLAMQGTAAVWQATQRLSRGLWWLDALASPGKWWHRVKGKARCEFAAISAARNLINTR